MISWFDAAEYCDELGMRLPTEAEWEYAARGPSGWIYPWDNDFLLRNLVYKNNSGNQTASDIYTGFRCARDFEASDLEN